MTYTPLNVAVFGASSFDIDPAYYDFAYELGRFIALRGYNLVNGGGRQGLMAATIDGVLDGGGKAIGVLPGFMVERGWQHPHLSEMITTDTMQERKDTIMRLSGGAIALPGGVGTLDELFEIITMRQLGLYKGSIVIANVKGFYNELLEHLRLSDKRGFIRATGLWDVSDNPDEALAMAMCRQEMKFHGEKY